MQSFHTPINPLDIKIRLWVGIIGACIFLLAFVIGMKVGAADARYNSGLSSSNIVNARNACTELYMAPPSQELDIQVVPLFRERKSLNKDSEEIIELPEGFSLDKDGTKL